MSHDEMVKVVTEMVTEILCLEDEVVRPSDRFFEDLGGESIEILELQFALEKRFGGRIPLQGIGPRRELEVDSENRLTPAACEQLGAQFPFLNLRSLGAHPPLERMTELLTIDAIAHLVEQVLRERTTAGAGASGSVRPAGAA